MLVIVALFVSGYRPKARGAALPWFVIDLFLLAGINSLGLTPSATESASTKVATVCLAAALTATAIKSPLAKFVEAGTRPLFVLAAASFAAFGLALIAALTVIH